MSNQILINSEYTIRPVKREDKIHILTGLSDPQVTLYYGVHYNNIEEIDSQMDWYEQLVEKNTGQWWVLETSDEGQFVGTIGINDWDHVHKKAEVGFWLIPNFWGAGIMKSALSWMVSYAFDQLHIHRLEAYVEPENRPCRELLKRCGFNLEGKMEDCEWKNNQFISLLVFARLNK